MAGYPHEITTELPNGIHRCCLKYTTIVAVCARRLGASSWSRGVLGASCWGWSTPARPARPDLAIGMVVCHQNVSWHTEEKRKTRRKSPSAILGRTVHSLLGPGGPVVCRYTRNEVDPQRVDTQAVEKHSYNRSCWNSRSTTSGRTQPASKTVRQLGNSLIPE